MFPQKEDVVWLLQSRYMGTHVSLTLSDNWYA